LVSAGISEFLPTLYEKVSIPPAVLEELKHEHSPLKDWIANAPSWLQVSKPTMLISDVGIDEGEREAISIAISLEADAILIDEKAAREVARQNGLTVTGTLGVIIDGHRRGLFNGIEVLDRLAQTNFYASRELLAAVRTELQTRN
jgi:predicted nucleic acid-binding protein